MEVGVTWLIHPRPGWMLFRKPQTRPDGAFIRGIRADCGERE